MYPSIALVDQSASCSEASSPAQLARHAAVYLHAAQTLKVVVTDVHSSQRALQEAFIKAVYRRIHQAEIQQFMPIFLSLLDPLDQLLAICGIRHGDHGPLFLEQYLDDPIEQLLSSHIGSQVSRQHIVEVGNLAVASPAHIRSLLASLNAHLHSTQVDWVVFTGINTLYNSLRKLNIPMHILGKADLGRLPDTQHAAWGSYYQANPQVIAVQRFQPHA